MKPATIAIAFFLGLAALPGLAAKKDAPEHQEPHPGAMKPGDGLVLLRIIATRDVATNILRWESVKVRNLQSRKEFTLTNLFYGKTHSSYFRDSLPPGDYEAVVAESGPADNPTALSIAMSNGPVVKSPDGFRFKIAAGFLTDLGTLFYVRPYSPSDTDRHDWIHAGDTDLAQRAKFLLDPASADLVLAAPLGWTAIPQNSQRARLTERMKHMSMELNGRSPTADGGLLFGELFGQIARRSRDGAWTWEDTGSADTIAAAVESPDGAMWAAAENSTLLRRDSPGRWRRIEVPLDNGTACFLGAEKDGSVTTVWETPTSIVMFSHRGRGEPATVETRKIEFSYSFFGAGARRCSVLQSDPYLAIMTSTWGFASSKVAFDVLNRATGEWKKYPDSKLNGAIGMFADGGMYALSGPNLKQQFRVSSDFGKTWETRTSVSWSGLPVFRDANDGFLIHTDHVPLLKTENFAMSLWVTADGGRNWLPRASLPPGAFAATIVLEGQGLLFVNTTGQLYLSRDNGKTIAMERDSSVASW